MKNKNKRDIKNMTKFKLWAESHGHCPCCNISLFNFSDKDHNEQIMKKYVNKQNEVHCGDIAHIVSLNSEKIRPCNKKYESLNRFDDYFNDGKYSENFLNSFDNLIIVCTHCHYKIDGKMPNVESKNNDFLDKYKTDEEQIKYLINSKNLEDNINLGEMFLRLPDIIITTIEELKPALNNIEILINDLRKNSVTEDDIEIFCYGEFVTSTFEGREEFIEEIYKYNKEKGNININKLELGESFFKEYYLKIIFHQKEKKNLILIDLINKKNFLGNKTKSLDEIEIQLKKDYPKFESKLEWMENISKPNDKILETLKSQPDYDQLKLILFKRIKDFVTTNIKNKNSLKKFDSFSIAYLGGWGSGKTTIIRLLSDEMKTYFNFIEISLWSISNLVTKNNNEWKGGETDFVKVISKEIISQLTSDPELVDSYYNGTSSFKVKKEEFDFQYKLKKEIMNLNNEETIDVFKDRIQFIDQYIYFAEKIMWMYLSRTHKPTVIVFDDLDRVQDNGDILKILDSLISFYSLKNVIYIITMDEAKIISALTERNRSHVYMYMNKYFNQTIKGTITPQLNSKIIIENQIKWYAPNLYKQLENNNKWFKIASELFPLDYRGIKDHINLFISNKYSIYKNEYFNILYKKTNKEFDLDILILFSTIIQIHFPMLVNFWVKNFTKINKLWDIKEILNTFKSNLENHVPGNQFSIKFEKDEEVILLSILGTTKNEAEKNYSNKEQFHLFKVECNNSILEFEHILNTFNELLGLEKANYSNLILWIAITNSLILNKECQRYIAGIKFLAFLENNLDDDCMHFMQDNNIDDEKEFIEYSENIWSFYEDGFIKEQQMISISNSFITKNIALKKNIRWNDMHINFIANMIMKKDSFNKTNIYLNLFTEKHKLQMWNNINKIGSKEFGLKNKLKDKTSFENLISCFAPYIDEIEIVLPKELVFENEKFNLAFIKKNKNKEKIKILNLIPCDLLQNIKNEIYISELLYFYSSEINEIKNLNEFTINIDEHLRNIKLINKHQFASIKNRNFLLSECEDLTDFSLLPHDFIKDNLHLYKNKYESISQKEIDKIIFGTNFVTEFSANIIDLYLLKLNYTILDFIIERYLFIDKIKASTKVVDYFNERISKHIEIKTAYDLLLDQKHVYCLIHEIDVSNNIKNSILYKYGFTLTYSFKGEPLSKDAPIKNVLEGITNIDYSKGFDINYLKENKGKIYELVRQNNVYIKKYCEIINNLFNFLLDNSNDENDFADSKDLDFFKINTKITTEIVIDAQEFIEYVSTKMSITNLKEYKEIQLLNEKADKILREFIDTNLNPMTFKLNALKWDMENESFYYCEQQIKELETKKEFIQKNKIYSNNMIDVDLENLSHQDIINKYEHITSLKNKSTTKNNELYENTISKINIVLDNYNRWSQMNSYNLNHSKDQYNCNDKIEEIKLEMNILKNEINEIPHLEFKNKINKILNKSNKLNKPINKLIKSI